MEDRLARLKNPKNIIKYQQFYQLQPPKTTQPDHLFNPNAEDHMEQRSHI